MRILYGVVGEGMGHATRSLVVLDHLLRAGHEARVVVSGPAHHYLAERLRGFDNVKVEEIRGLTLRYFGNRVDRTDSLFWNLQHAPESIRKNVEVYRRVAEEGFRPQMVVSDFESFAAFYAARHRLPIVSIDNIQTLDRCRHDPAIRRDERFDFALARAAVKIKVPGAYHYLVTSFFFPPVRKKRTTLVPPILRPEVISASREPGEHVLVYVRTAAPEELVAMLQKIPHSFRLYGADREAETGNVRLRSFSEQGFLEDLRTARAVIGGGGFSLMSEAVSLRVPMLSFPVEHQFEQQLNARYLERLGYGAWTPRLDGDVIAAFLDRADEFSQNLAAYERRDNAMALACLDELIDRVARGAERPDRLESPAVRKWGDDA